MKLNKNGIKERQAWEDKGIKLPEFDIEAMKAKTLKNPEWIHFGAGNIFRGFIGSIAQRLLNSGEMNTGIIAAESFDFEIIDKIYNAYNNLTLNVMMDKNSSLDTEVLAGIAEGVKATNYGRLREIITAPSLQLISFTITEKGYAVTDINGNLLNVVKEDIKNGISAPKHTMSLIAALLYKRYQTCAAPLAVVSMDNCSHNGEKLKAGVMTVVNAWCESGVMEKGFIGYLENMVTFPWSMIDKITPRPDDKIKNRHTALGVEDMDAVITSKGTYIAPFVNAEIPQYLVIEDSFPNGRPPFEKAGVYMTDRETVNKAETMKVTTCLNPLHTGLAVFGCLLGYKTIWEEMKDKELVNLVMRIADEGMKVVIDPKIIDPKKFVNEVINDRLPNPNIPDAPQRIATDTSQKIPVRYGETIKAYIASSELDVRNLNAIPMVIAGWLRYLLAYDDAGNEFTPSADPMLEEMQNKLKGVNCDTAGEILKDILSNPVLFGVNLYDAGLSEKTEKYFKMMLDGKGAVRAALRTL